MLPLKRNCIALEEIVGPSNQNQKERPISRCMTKNKPNKKLNSTLLKKLTITTTMATGAIWWHLGAVTGDMLQS